MSDGYDLVNTINDLILRLNKAVTFLKDAGLKYAEAEKEYRSATAQEMLKLKAEGMAVGMIDKVAQGNVAEQRFKKDAAEAYYKAAQENINALKIEIKVLDNQIQREWGQANG